MDKLHNSVKRYIANFFDPVDFYMRKKEYCSKQVSNFRFMETYACVWSPNVNFVILTRVSEQLVKSVPGLLLDWPYYIKNDPRMFRHFYETYPTVYYIPIHLFCF